MEIVRNFQKGDFRVSIFNYEGELLFSAKEVAQSLGYRKTNNAVSRHVSDIFKVRIASPVHGGMPRIYLKEPGLYELIFGSELPDAKKYRYWVFTEVLPSITRTGSYNIPNSQKIKEIRNETTRDSPDFYIIKCESEGMSDDLKDPRKIEMGKKGGFIAQQNIRELKKENKELKKENKELKDKNLKLEVENVVEKLIDKVVLMEEVKNIILQN